MSKTNYKAHLHQNLRPLWYKMDCTAELVALLFICQLFIYVLELLHVVSLIVCFMLLQNGTFLH